MSTIQFTPGTVYDVEHLRPFDLELAKAGHPLATDGGNAVRLFRMHSEIGYIWDWWNPRFKKWAHLSDSETCLPDWLRLAPLAIKDGRGLHAGDEIEVAVWDDEACEKKSWEATTANVGTAIWTNWRWPQKD